MTKKDKHLFKLTGALLFMDRLLGHWLELEFEHTVLKYWSFRTYHPTRHD